MLLVLVLVLVLLLLLLHAQLSVGVCCLHVALQRCLSGSSVVLSRCCAVHGSSQRLLSLEPRPDVTLCCCC
jgi:hypothetical protein